MFVGFLRLEPETSGAGLTRQRPATSRRHGNLERLDDARLWAGIVCGPIQPVMAKLLPLIGRSRATDRVHGREA
jgi:hypothetical protein